MAIRNLSNLNQQLAEQIEADVHHQQADQRAEPKHKNQEPAGIQPGRQEAQHAEPPAPVLNEGHNQNLSQPENQAVMNIDCNISILQSDLRKLRKSGHQAQTFRLTGEDLDWLKNKTYTLSRSLDKKISQSDLIRIGQLLFKRVWKGNKAPLIKILEEL